MAINDKQRAFIIEYLVNGHNASQAYKKAYPKVKGGWNKLSARLMANEGIKQEIARKRAVLEVKTEYTLTQYLLELEAARQRAIARQSHAAEVSAVVAKGRSMGFDKDNDTGAGKQVELSETERKEAEAFAAWQLRQDLRLSKADSA